MAKDKRLLVISINPVSAKRMGKEKFIDLHKGLATRDELSKEFDKVVPPKAAKEADKK